MRKNCNTCGAPRVEVDQHYCDWCNLRKELHTEVIKLTVAIQNIEELACDKYLIAENACGKIEKICKEVLG